MAFDRRQAEANLQEILRRIRAVDFSIDRDIIDYRRNDTIVDEADEYKTMRDIRYYLLNSYRKIGDILTILDKYQ